MQNEKMETIYGMLSVSWKHGIVCSLWNKR